MINPVNKKADITKKAEFIIQLNWPDGSSDDIDLWVMDPQGNKIGFNNKENGLLNLERDDLGQSNDIVIIQGTPHIIKKNEEITSIRGIVPGTYYISVHYYSQFNKANGAVPITVTVIKINPYKEVYKEQKKISKEGQTVNFIRFEVSDTGAIFGLEKSSTSAVGDHGRQYRQSQGGPYK